MISVAQEFGVKAVTITSSGNAGGAVAAYANAASMDAYCFVPVSFSPSGKRAGYVAYDPTALIGMHGFYEEISAIAIELGLKHGWYITNHGFNPYRMEGDKTIAYELCMDLGWRAPQHVIVPTGSGGNLAGQWKGFKELYALGWIESLPRMSAIQVEAGAPLVQAFEQGLDRASPYLEAGESIADGVVSIYDDYAVQALQTIRESGGTVIAVSEKEILQAERLLAKKEGIFVEPSSAVAVAGAQRLIEQGFIQPDELTVHGYDRYGSKKPRTFAGWVQFSIRTGSHTQCHPRNRGIYKKAEIKKMSTRQEWLLNRANELEERIIRWRREIHSHPELGFQEIQTSRLVAQTLEELGIKVKTGVAKTGVIGRIGEGSPAIGLRADMDALALQETNDVPYASQVPGIMHACGHDTHVAILLGAAQLLSELSERPAGEIRFLFQPCEENVDNEGKSGAPRMVEEGAVQGLGCCSRSAYYKRPAFRCI